MFFDDACFDRIGCEEEDGAYGTASSEITLTSFANSYDSKANATAIARIDETYRTGAREIKTTNLINSYSNQSLNDLDRTVLADDFGGDLKIKISRLIIGRSNAPSMKKIPTTS
ncbi:MAG: hypothetical protein V7689_13075 [Psychrobacter sp.]